MQSDKRSKIGPQGLANLQRVGKAMNVIDPKQAPDLLFTEYVLPTVDVLAAGNPAANAPGVAGYIFESGGIINENLGGFDQRLFQIVAPLPPAAGIMSNNVPGLETWVLAMEAQLSVVADGFDMGNGAVTVEMWMGDYDGTGYIVKRWESRRDWLWTPSDPEGGLGLLNYSLGPHTRGLAFTVPASLATDPSTETRQDNFPGERSLWVPSGLYLWLRVAVEKNSTEDSDPALTFPSGTRFSMRMFGVQNCTDRNNKAGTLTGKDLTMMR